MDGDGPSNPAAKADSFAGKVNLLVLTCVLAALALVLYRLPAHLDNLRPKSQCFSNMKQVGTSLHMYAEANDQRLPSSEWSDAIYVYAKNWDLFTCDKVREKQERWGYALHWKALGVNLTSVSDPAMRVMLFETDALGKGVVANLAAIGTPRHGDRVVVGRFDTSTRSMLPEEARLLEP